MVKPSTAEHLHRSNAAEAEESPSYSRKSQEQEHASSPIPDPSIRVSSSTPSHIQATSRTEAPGIELVEVGVGDWCVGVAGMELVELSSAKAPAPSLSGSFLPPMSLLNSETSEILVVFASPAWPGKV